jgi:Mrp family chromosome partitioning ATPase
VTLIDTPPVLGLADVSLLASRVDGIILIVHQNLTHREQMSQALKQLEATQANVIGSIFVQKGNKIQSYV